MALVIFIALLLEVGSGLGMYIAFSQWRLGDRHVPAQATAVPTMTKLTETPAVVAVEPAVPALPEPRVGANDNKSAPIEEEVAPGSDVERYQNERVESQDGSSLTATALYEDYCAWCDEQEKEPLALPTFGREFGELGVQKAKIAGRVRYIGVALKTGTGATEDKNVPVPIVKAA